MKQFAIAAMMVACGGTPDTTAVPTGGSIATPDATTVAAVVVDATPPAPAIDGAIDHAPLCGRPWRTVVTSLHALVADDKAATLCARSDSAVTDCARLDFATGAFTNVGMPVVPTTVAQPHWADPTTMKLDVPPADAAKIAESSFGYDVSADGKLAIVVLPDENTVGVFDSATGKRTRTLKVTTKDAKCVGPAFWIGDVVYASARTCDDLEMYSKHAYMFVGDKRTPAKDLLFGGEARTPLANNTWAVVSQKPYRLDVIDGKTGAVKRSVPLPQLAREDGNLALGLSPFGTMPLDTSPVVVSGDALVVVSSRAIARIPPTGAPKVWPFAKCE